MALINCPECGKQISDKAEKCISCGYRMNGNYSESNYPNQTSGNNRQRVRNHYAGYVSANASFGFAFFGLFAWMLPIIGFPISIAGLIFGIVSLSKSTRTLAVVGVILCSLELIATIINAISGAIIWGQIFSNQF